MVDITQIVSIFFAGLLTSVSPCVYPTLPLTLSFLSYQSKASDSKKPVLLFFLGQSLAYVLIGFLAVKLGEIFGFTSQSKGVNAFIAIILFLMAIVSLTGFIPSKLVNGSNLIRKKIESYSHAGAWAAFFIGCAAAFVASPCTSPILGGVLATVAAKSWSLTSFLMLFAYGVGSSLLLLVVGLGLLKMKNLPKPGKWLTFAHKFTGVLILFASFYYTYKVFA